MAFLPFRLLQLPWVAYHQCLDSFEILTMLSLGLTSEKMKRHVLSTQKKFHLSIVVDERDIPFLAIIDRPSQTDNAPIADKFNASAEPVEQSEKKIWRYKGKSFEANFNGLNELRLYPGVDYDFWGLLMLLERTLQPFARDFSFYSLEKSANMVKLMQEKLSVIKVTLLGEFEADMQYFTFMDFFVDIPAMNNQALSPFLAHYDMDHWHFSYLNIEHGRWLSANQIVALTNCLTLRLNRCRNFDEDIIVVIKKWVGEVCRLRNFEMISDDARPPFNLERIVRDFDHEMLTEVTMTNGQIRRFGQDQCARIQRFDGVSAIIYCVGQAFHLDRV